MTYTSGLSGKMAAVFGGLVIAVVVGLIAGALLIEVGVSARERALLLGTAAAVAAVVLLISIVWVFAVAPVTIRTSPTTVEVLRRGRVRESWQRAEAVFSPFVVRESTNGVRTGSVRTLVVTTATTQVNVLCRWFSAETFNALLADVAPLVPAGTPAALPAVTTGRFQIDRPLGRVGWRLAVVAIAVGVVGVVAVLLAEEIGASSPIAITIIVIVTAALALLAMSPLLVRMRRIPRELTVSQSSLTFDERIVPIGQLTAIRATTPAHSGARRTIVLTETTGRRTVIDLGLANGTVFAEYPAYLETIRGATAHRPGLFTLDVA